MFGPLAELLGDTARVVRWDQRGCGRSDRRGPYTLARSIADLNAVRERLAGVRMALLGHSWGATLALRYALLHPDRVTALVYVSGTGIDPEQTWHPAYRQNLRDRLGLRLRRWEEIKQQPARATAEDRELAVLQWSADFADESRAAQLAEQIATPWLGINYDANAALNAEVRRYLQDSDVARQCRESQVRTLIIHGAADIRPSWVVDSLHGALPRSQRAILDDVGHLPWLEDPDGFRTAVADFLTSVT